MFFLSAPVSSQAAIGEAVLHAHNEGRLKVPPASALQGGAEGPSLVRCLCVRALVRTRCSLPVRTGCCRCVWPPIFPVGDGRHNEPVFPERLVISHRPWFLMLPAPSPSVSASRPCVRSRAPSCSTCPFRSGRSRPRFASFRSPSWRRAETAPRSGWRGICRRPASFFVQRSTTSRTSHDS